MKRPPHEYIGGVANPYMLRWHVLKRDWLSIYLHRFEVMPLPEQVSSDTDVHSAPVKIRWRRPGSIIFRRATQPHRIAVGFFPDGRTQRYPLKPIWSLWIRGPIARDWGFYTARGWVQNRQYVPDDIQ